MSTKQRIPLVIFGASRNCTRAQCPSSRRRSFCSPSSTSGDGTIVDPYGLRKTRAFGTVPPRWAARPGTSNSSCPPWRHCLPGAWTRLDTELLSTTLHAGLDSTRDLSRCCSQDSQSKRQATNSTHTTQHTHTHTHRGTQRSVPIK